MQNCAPVVCRPQPRETEMMKVSMTVHAHERMGLIIDHGLHPPRRNREQKNCRPKWNVEWWSPLPSRNRNPMPVVPCTHSSNISCISIENMSGVSTPPCLPPRSKLKCSAGSHPGRFMRASMRDHSLMMFIIVPGCTPRQRSALVIKPWSMQSKAVFTSRQPNNNLCP